MTRNAFEQYYIQQAQQSGHGIPIFIGSQRGNGLGGILSGLARMVVPVLKRGGKSILKETLRTGVDVLGDVVSGENLKTSAKRRLKQGGSRLLQQASASITPQPSNQRTIKRKKTAPRHQSAPKRRKVNTQTRKDIFN